MNAQFVAVNCQFYGHLSQHVDHSNCVIESRKKKGGRRETEGGGRERDRERMRGRERACARKEGREGGGVEETRESARERPCKLERERVLFSVFKVNFW